MNALNAVFLYRSILLLSTLIGTGLVGAATYQHGGSTTTIHQNGGNSASNSQVTRYQDGQKIITQDGNSTDITIQRSGSSPVRDNEPEYTGTGHDHFFERDAIEARFSRFGRDYRWNTDCADWAESLECEPPDNETRAHDDFKQRMLNRMRGDFTTDRWLIFGSP